MYKMIEISKQIQKENTKKEPKHKGRQCNINGKKMEKEKNNNNKTILIKRNSKRKENEM